MRRGLALVGLVVLALTAASGCCSAPLPAPRPYEGELPPASPPPELSIAKLPTGVTHRSAAVAYRGGSYFDKRDFAMTAVLVRHPRGDLLIDSGFGRDVAGHLQLMPWSFRVTTDYERSRSVAEQLEAAHYDRSRLKGVLLTHAHWDHVSGLPELPGTPVWVTPEERQFIDSGGFVTAVARSFQGLHYETYAFEGGPYLGFPRSHDVFGDGSVVVVPAPGHTPGSVIVFVALPDRRRFAFVGDLVWQREGITEREERPWGYRTFGDEDEAAVRENILRVAALSARFPELIIVPAHDARGFEGIPDLR